MCSTVSRFCRCPVIDIGHAFDRTGVRPGGRLQADTRRGSTGPIQEEGGMSATTATRPAVGISTGRRAHLRLVTAVPDEPRALRLTRRGRLLVGIAGWFGVVAAGVLVVMVA